MRHFAVGMFFCVVCSQSFAVEFGNVTSLGDSLLDDILGLRSPLVSEHLADRLDAPLTQFAVAGSTSASMIRQGQHSDAAATFDQGDLATLWIGGNDFFVSTANPFGVGIGNLRFMDRLEDNVDTVLGTLRDAGMDVLVFNLPDMAKVPFTDAITLFNFQLRNISEATLEWNSRLADLAEEHGAHLVDIYSLFEDAIENPAKYAVEGHELVFGPEFGCEWCVFSDPIHPSALSQGLITNLAIDVLNESYGGTPLEKLSEAELAMLADPDDTWLDRWQTSYNQHTAAGDQDGDGDTDGHDFLLLQRLGKINVTVSFSATAVPEPGGVALALSCLCFVTRRNTRRVG